jgi:hypothetical protein
MVMMFFEKVGGSKYFLHWVFLFSMLASPVATLSAQITFEDLRAGYLENEAKLQGQGLRVIYRLKHKDFFVYEEESELNHINALRGLLDSEELSADDIEAIKNMADSREQALGRQPHLKDQDSLFELYFDKHGVAVRFVDIKEPALLPGEENGNDYLSSLLKSSSFSAFDTEVSALRPETAIWSAADGCVYYESNKSGIKSFGILPGKISDQSFPTGGPIPLDYRVNARGIPNVPISVPAYPSTSSPFIAAADLIYFWQDHPDTIREVTMLDDHLVELVVRMPFKRADYDRSIESSQYRRAVIDVSRGFLPVKITFGGIAQFDGEIYDSKDRQLQLAATLDIGQIGDAFFIRTFHREDYARVIEYPIDPARRLWEMGGIVRHLNKYGHRPESPEKTKLRNRLSLEVEHIERWSSNAGAEFSVEPPPGVRFSNTITGETRLESDSTGELELDLEAGDNPIAEGFRGSDELEPQSTTLMMRIGYWAVLIFIGLLLVFVSKKMRKSSR